MPLLENGGGEGGGKKERLAGKLLKLNFCIERS